MKACINGHKEIVKLLFDHSDTKTTNLNAKDIHGRTPFNIISFLATVKILTRQFSQIWKTVKLIYFAGNYTLGSPGGHSASGLFTGGMANGHHGGPHQGHPHGGHGQLQPPHQHHQQQSFLNGGSSLANLGLMTSSHNLPNIHNQSPTSVLSNYSLNRNLNQLNLNLVPRTNR